MAYPHVYGLWTNKGGVGKTTLSYHLASHYAELFPNKIVVAIDMCPQANLSSTLLTNASAGAVVPNDREGPKKVDLLHESTRVAQTLPMTVAGLFINYLQQNLAVSPEEWLVNVQDGVSGMFLGNPHMPKNLHLMCGDRSLDLLVEELAKKATGTAAVYNPYRAVHTVLRCYIENLAKHFKKPPNGNKEVVVFIDTNPALSIYTHIALVAMSELIIPVNADCFSMEAINNMFRLLYGLYPSTGRVVAAFEKTMFGFKAREMDIPVPKITAIVHNKTPVMKEASAPGENFRRPKIYKELAASHAGLLFDGYKKAAACNELDRVFCPREDGPFNAGQGQLQRFSAAYTGTMRDMRSAGVAALHTGVPLWMLPEKSGLINRKFNGSDITGRLPFLINDMLAMMKAIFGENVMSNADPAAKTRMELLAAPARAQGDDNDAAQPGGAPSDGADDDDDDEPDMGGMPNGAGNARAQGGRAAAGAAAAAAPAQPGTSAASRARGGNAGRRRRRSDDDTTDGKKKKARPSVAKAPKAAGGKAKKSTGK